MLSSWARSHDMLRIKSRQPRDCKGKRRNDSEQHLIRTSTVIRRTQTRHHGHCNIPLLVEHRTTWPIKHLLRKSSKAPVARMVATPEPQDQPESTRVENTTRALPPAVEVISVTSSPPRSESGETSISLGASDNDYSTDEELYPSIPSRKHHLDDSSDEWRPPRKSQRMQSPAPKRLIVVLKLSGDKMARLDRPLLSPTIHVSGARKTPAKSQAFQDIARDTTRSESYSQNSTSLWMPPFTRIVNETVATVWDHTNTLPPCRYPTIESDKPSENVTRDRQSALRGRSPMSPVESIKSPTDTDHPRPRAPLVTLRQPESRQPASSQLHLANSNVSQPTYVGTPLTAASSQRESARRVGDTPREQEQSERVSVSTDVHQPRTTSSKTKITCHRALSIAAMELELGIEPPAANSEEQSPYDVKTETDSARFTEPPPEKTESVEPATQPMGRTRRTSPDGHPVTTASPVGVPTIAPTSAAEHDVAHPAQTALERVYVLVYWSENDDTYDIIDLTDCKTHTDLFAYLRHMDPEETENRRVKSVVIRLENAEEAGLEREVRISASTDAGGAKAFEWLVKALAAYSEDVQPVLTCTVQFWKQ